VPVIDVADVVAAVRRAPPVGRTRIVGVDGRAGAGKSTLARLLVDRMDATLVPTDDFASWDDLAGWWPRFEAEVLVPLRTGRDATYQVRDWIGDEFGRSLGPWRTARWTPVVVVEGVTCTRREAAAALSYRVWVEAGEATRLARGLRRDGETHRDLWLAWQRQEDAFFAVDRPATRADLIVCTDAGVPHEPERQLVTPGPDGC
jgi:hypothetical protein